MIKRLSLTAAIGAIAEDGGFEAVIIVEGLRTADDREIAMGALTWRELPLPITLDVESPGHGGQVVGRLEEITRVNNGATAELRGRGTFDLGSEAGREAKRLVDEQVLRWLSAELDILASEFIEEGDCGGEDGPFQPGCTVIMRVLQGRIAAAAMVAIPAFPEAVIVPAGAEIPAATPEGRPAPESIAASACTDCDPPLAWFTQPDLDGPTPLTIIDGRVFGHAALSDSCHTGYPGQCLTPPESASGYAYFRTGSIMTQEGIEVAVGQITLGTGHADLSSNARDAASHYDDTGTAVADVAAGEDMYGIWIAGALRPGVTEQQVRALRASSLSGDWRKIGGNLEMVALLAVNVPGFPVTRSLAAAGIVQGQRTQARIGSDQQVLALVAAASPKPAERGDLEAVVADLQRQVAALRLVTDEFRSDAASRLVASL